MSPRPSGCIDRSARIRALNDRYRRLVTHPFRGGAVLTPGVCALSVQDLVELVLKVYRFDSFTHDNDPHGEHDFGAIDHAETRFFWKIDYYDLKLQMHSPDPSDPDVTRRVLTLMRADEY